MGNLSANPHKQRVLGSLTLAVGLTLLVLGWLAQTVFRSHGFITLHLPQAERMEELRGQILLMDEILTMSVRMAAATSEPQWEARYLRFEPQLEATLQEAMRLAPRWAGSQAARQTDLANTKLVAMEKRAFALVRQAQPAAARVLLERAEYEANKTAFAGGMIEIGRRLKQMALLAQEKQRAALRWSVILTAVSAPLLLLSWGWAWRAVRRWRTAVLASNQLLSCQAEELRQKQECVDQLAEQRRRMEQIMRLTQFTVDHAAEVIAWIRADATYAYVNEATCRLLGYSREELVNKSVPEINPLMTLQKWQILWQRLRHEKTLNYEAIFVTKEGRRVPMEAAVSYLLFEGQEYSCGFARDISERKEAEQALRQSEELFRTLFDGHSAVKLIINPETGEILDANHAAAAFYGWPIEQLRHMRMQQLNTLPPEIVAAEMGLAQSARKQRFEFRHRRADGSIRDVEVFSNGIEVAGRTLLYSIIHDITPRKQAEAEREKLEAQNRQLQKAESLSRMAGAIAHHFNNQLHVVLVNLEMVREDLPSAEEKSLELLTDATLAARKAAEVSSLMLMFLGQTQGHLERLDLAETCQRHLPMLRAVMPPGLDLETRLPSPGPIVLINPTHLHQVLTHLATNAWESMGDGCGTIGLCVKTIPAGEIPGANWFPIDFQPHAEAYACLEVTDSGCGVAEQNLERIFDPFFSSKFTGRGMGLAVVLGVMRAHGGVVTVDSEPGRGSVFRVLLPISDEPAPPKSTPASRVPQTAELGLTAPSRPIGGKHASAGTVLVVEDEPVLRKAVTLALKRLGYGVLTANDGVEALELFPAHQAEICCVLCDLTMPRLDGWGTMAALRKLAPDLPVILASGYSAAQVMAEDHPATPQAFLHKPYEAKQLAEVLARIIKAQPPEP